MNWLKKGLILAPQSELIPVWGKKRLMLPTPIRLNDEVIRIFLGFCDIDQVGRIGYVDVDVNNPSIIKDISESPLLNVGEDGAFDDNGVVPTSIIRNTDMMYHLYYAGYQSGVKVKYYIFDGLAFSNSLSKAFHRYSKTPIIDRRKDEIYFRTGSFVLKDNGIWKMWYIGGGDWLETDQKKIPVYKCKYLESKDGIHWDGEPIVCLEFDNENEHGFSRPWIVKEENKYKMFYSIRSLPNGYKPGYAESLDGINWERLDYKVGISLSDTVNEWDSKMICYPSIITTNKKTFLFYNGNDFGGTGFGYAELNKQ